MSEPGARGPYRVEIAPASARELGRLRADDAARLRRPILALAVDPRAIGAPVVGTSYLRIRVGDLRVTYTVDDTARRVVVGRIAKRSDSTYRRL